jgi:hypothetical protein
MQPQCMRDFKRLKITWNERKLIPFMLLTSSQAVCLAEQYNFCVSQNGAQKRHKTCWMPSFSFVQDSEIGFPSISKFTLRLYPTLYSSVSLFMYTFNGRPVQTRVLRYDYHYCYYPSGRLESSNSLAEKPEFLRLTFFSRNWTGSFLHNEYFW